MVSIVFFNPVREVSGGGGYRDVYKPYVVGAAKPEDVQALIEESVAAMSPPCELKLHERFGDMTVFEGGKYPCGYYTIQTVKMYDGTQQRIEK